MKKNILLAVTSGLLLAASWPTYGVPLLLFIAFVPLLWTEFKLRNASIKRKKRKIFALAYTTFVLWNVLTTGWLYYADLFGMLFAVLVNALLMSLVFLLYHVVAKRVPTSRGLLFLPAVWIAFEKLHLGWDFSWPWLNLGNAFSEYYHWIQWYEYTGTFGGTLWVWIVNCGVFVALKKYASTKNKKALYRSLSANLLVVAIPIIISLFIYASYQEPQKKVSVIALQPNVDPYTEKYNMANLEVAQNLFELAKNNTTQKTDFILAPETVFAEGFGERLNTFRESELYKKLKTYNQQNPTINLLVGIQFFNTYNQKSQITKFSNRLRENLWYDTYNSALFMNAYNDFDVYHKSKLVVGIETFPYKSILEPLLGNIMIDLGGTVAVRTTQEERDVFTSFDGNYSAAPIICYESVYGEFVTGYVRNGANFLAIITNDGWWQETQGHKQHLSYARLRAIETRRSIARSANTGISALINQKGDIIKSLPYNTEGAVSGSISVNDKITFYTRFGDYIARLAMFVGALILLTAFAKKRSEV